MKETGILFKDEMIRAYLAGLKSETRRLKGLKAINEQPEQWSLAGMDEAGATFRRYDGLLHRVRYPYGGVGDELYFKEVYFYDEVSEMITFRASCTGVEYPSPKLMKWNTSLFMPREYSRFRHVPILAVQVERLQDITLKGVAAEGWPDAPKTQQIWVAELPNAWSTGFAWYEKLWDSINFETMPFSKNPWLFIYKFPNKER